MAEGRLRDVAAYSDLVKARSGSLFRTAYLMVGDHQLAQDLLQESLVKTYVAAQDRHHDAVGAAAGGGIRLVRHGAHHSP
jgi:DNA-directed RNA polymerase specialized sigma24 family protein